MSRADKSKLRPVMSHYDANYGGFQTDLYAQIRREAFGEDIGQNSWLTTQEQDMFLGWLGLCPGKTLLDVACCLWLGRPNTANGRKHWLRRCWN